MTASAATPTISPDAGMPTASVIWVRKMVNTAATAAVAALAVLLLGDSAKIAAVTSEENSAVATVHPDDCKSGVRPAASGWGSVGPAAPSTPESWTRRRMIMITAAAV